MPKDKSSFDEIFAARRRAAGPAVSSAPGRPGDSAPDQPTRKRGKYDDPDYTRLTFYIRKDTDMLVRQKLLGQGKRELSDIFQKLAEGWVTGRFDV